MKMNKVLFICLLTSISLLLSSSVFAQVKDKDHVQGVTKDEILLGGFFAISGPFSLSGLGQYQGSELYFNEVNAKGGIHGRKIKLLVEDDACQPTKGLAAVQKLLAEKPFMLYGPTCSGVALAALETIVKEGIPWCAYGPTTPKIFIPVRKNVFRAGSAPDNLQAKGIIDYDINDLKARKIAIIHDASEYGKGGADIMVDRLAEYGLKPVAIEAYNMGDTDFTTQVLKIKNAKPEVVHLYGYAKEGAIIVRQAKELGLDAQIILAAAMSVTSFLEAAGDAAIGVLSVYGYPYLIDSSETHIADFVNKLKATYRMTPGRPSYVELMGYGCAKVAVEGLQRAGKDLTWHKYIDAMEKMRDFKTDFIFPASFSPTDHNGIIHSKLLKVLPGKKWMIMPREVFPREKVEKIQ